LKLPPIAKIENSQLSKKIPPRGVEPLSDNSKTPVNKQLTKNANPVLSTSLDNLLQIYPDLAQLVKVWPELSGQARKDITEKELKELRRLARQRTAELSQAGPKVVKLPSA